MSPELYHLALWTTSSVIASVIAMWGLRALADHRVRQRDARA